MQTDRYHARFSTECIVIVMNGMRRHSIIHNQIFENALQTQNFMIELSMNSDEMVFQDVRSFAHYTKHVHSIRIEIRIFPQPYTNFLLKISALLYLMQFRVRRVLDVNNSSCNIMMQSYFSSDTYIRKCVIVCCENFKRFLSACPFLALYYSFIELLFFKHRSIILCGIQQNSSQTLSYTSALVNRFANQQHSLWLRM